MRLAICFGLLVASILWTGPVDADERTLLLEMGGMGHRLSASELLARPDVDEITVPDDVSYKQAKTYRVVPLLSLLPEVPEPFDTLDAGALDGFVAQIPLSFVRGAASGGSVAWLAVEPPGHPWPDLPGENFGPGPFYIVLQGPERSGVTKEQWPYQLASLTAVEMPGFNAQELPDAELDAVVACPQHVAQRKGAVQVAR